MEVSTNLLVAIMFVTILSMGIGGLLTALADLSRKKAVRCKLHISWIFILMFSHLTLFWSTGAAISLDWRFIGFLFVIAGPIFLFTTTHLHLSTAPEENCTGSNALVDDRMLQLFAIMQVWLVAMIVKLDGGFPPSASFNLALAVAALAMSMTSKPRSQAMGTTLIWLLLILDQSLRGTGVIN